MPAPGVVLLVIVVLIVLALVYFLVSTIVALRQITNGLDDAIKGVLELISKSEPVEPVVADINANLDVAVSALEGLLVKKAGLPDSMGLIDGLYPGAAAEGLRDFPDAKDITPPRISEVYTKGTLTLARLGREAPIAAASPNGPAVRNPRYATAASAALYPDARQAHPERMPRSPIIGTDSPVQYEPAETPGVRKAQPDGGGTTTIEREEG
jgi:hypothetical protein